MVCTANLCRSPIAAALLQRHLAAVGATARVESAGFGAPDLAPPRRVVDALKGVGLDVGDHRSVRATADMIRGADAVVGLAREHGRQAVALEPTAWRRTFTLKELVRRGTLVGPRGAGQPLGMWLGQLDGGRSPVALLGAARSDDVADPIGRGARTYRRTVRELDSLTAQLAELIAGTA